MKYLIQCSKQKGVQARQALQAAGFTIMPSVSGGAGGGFDQVPLVELTVLGSTTADSGALGDIKKKGLIQSFRQA